MWKHNEEKPITFIVYKSLKLKHKGGEKKNKYNKEKKNSRNFKNITKKLYAYRPMTLFLWLPYSKQS